MQEKHPEELEQAISKKLLELRVKHAFYRLDQIIAAAVRRAELDESKDLSEYETLQIQKIIYELFIKVDENGKQKLFRKISLNFHPDIYCNRTKNPKEGLAESHARTIFEASKQISEQKFKGQKDNLDNINLSLAEFENQISAEKSQVAKLHEAISEVPLLVWAYKHIFLTGDTETFKELYEYYFAKKQDKKKLSAHIAESAQYSGLAEENNLAEQALSITRKVLSGKDDLNQLAIELIEIQSRTESLLKYKPKKGINGQTLLKLQSLKKLLDLAIRYIAITQLGKYKEKEASLPKINKALTNVENSIKPSTMKLWSLLLLCYLYIHTFLVFIYPPLKTALYGTALLSGSLGASIFLSVMIGIASAITLTIIVVTISRIRSNIDSNKLFNALLYAAIFATLILFAPAAPILLMGKAGIMYKIAFSFIATSLIYNAFNILEIAIQKSLPKKVVIAISFIKDLTKETVLGMLFAVIGEPFCVLVQPYSYSYKVIEHNPLKSYAAIVIETAIVLALIAYGAVMVMPAGLGIIFNIFAAIALSALWGFMYWHFRKTFEYSSESIRLANINILFIEFIVNKFNSSYDFMQAHLDNSIPIANMIGNIFDAYRSKVATKLNMPATGIKHLDSVLLYIMHLVSFLLFITLYPVYEVRGNHPIKTVVFFIAAIILCAVFASPIQLFLFGHLVMTTSPIMGLIFGAITSSVATVLGANVYTVTNRHVRPYLATTFAASCSKVSDFYTNVRGCSNKAEASAKQPSKAL